MGAGLEFRWPRVQVSLWPPAGFVPGYSPWFKSSPVLVQSQLVYLLPVGILYLLSCLFYYGPEKPQRGVGNGVLIHTHQSVSMRSANELSRYGKWKNIVATILGNNVATHYIPTKVAWNITPFTSVLSIDYALDVTCLFCCVSHQKGHKNDTMLVQELLPTGFTVFRSTQTHRKRNDSMFLALKKNGATKNAFKASLSHKSSQFTVMLCSGNRGALTGNALVC